MKQKKNIFFYSITVLGMAAALTACTAKKGESDQNGGEDPTYREETFSLESAEKKENEPQTEDEAEVKTEDPQKDSGGDQNAGVFIPEVSDQEAEVVYAGEEFTKSVF